MAMKHLIPMFLVYHLTLLVIPILLQLHDCASRSLDDSTAEYGLTTTMTVSVPTKYSQTGAVKRLNIHKQARLNDYQAMEAIRKLRLRASSCFLLCYFSVFHSFFFFFWLGGCFVACFGVWVFFIEFVSVCVCGVRVYLCVFLIVCESV